MATTQQEGGLGATLRALGAVLDGRQPGERFDGDHLDRRDPRLIAEVLPAQRRLNRVYFRLKTEGVELLRPAPALYVANHNGGILGPDLFCTLGTLHRPERGRARVPALPRSYRAGRADSARK
jgi:hypothetical protein